MDEGNVNAEEVLKQYEDLSKVTAEELFRDLISSMLEQDQDTLTYRIEIPNPDKTANLIEFDTRIVKLISKE